MPRVLVFATHPVQYHVPLWRSLAAHRDLWVKVFYFSDHSIRGGVDPGFGVPVEWDVNLMSGYESEFVDRTANFERPASVRIGSVDALLAREPADWIVLQGYNMGFQRQLLGAARRHDARVLMRAEFSDLSYGPRPPWKRLAREAYLRLAYARVDRFCYPGEDGREHLLRHGVRAEQAFFSPYSVDDALIERAKRETTRAAARAALGIPDDRFVLLFSGKLIPRKAPMTLLGALARLANLNRVGLVVLGDGELRKPFEERARALLGERLVVPGFVNQSRLGPYFLASDGLVLPSEHETWGLVVNEAMHYGLPSIVGDQVGCRRDLVRPGETGLVFRCGDEADLARSLARWVDMPDEAKRMGRAASALIRRYTIAESAAGMFRALGVAVPPAPAS